MYRYEKHKSFLRTFNIPDRACKTLVNDFQNYVDMSTFLENGYILLRCRTRFMIFTSTANFIQEVNFNNDNMDEESSNDQIDEISEEEMVENEPNDEVEDFAAKKKRRREIIDFKGNVYIEKKEIQEPPLSVINKMELIQFSFNNRFYIFYDRILEKLLVYELCIFEQDEDPDLNEETHHQNENFSCH